MAEMLVVVGIILVIAAVAFVSIISYMRSLAKRQYDGYAKEIFVAAQNHLAAAESQGYLGLTKFGEPVTKDGEKTGNYYFVVNVAPEKTGWADVKDPTTTLSLMLPFASVDETVRSGGCYIVCYNKNVGQVAHVYYWEKDGRYKLDYVDDDYATFLTDSSKSALIRYGQSNAVIGCYSEDVAEMGDLKKLPALISPLIDVLNAERLQVTVTDGNDGSIEGYTLQLIITGSTSGAKKAYTLRSNDSSRPVTADSRISGSAGSYVVTLDDITATGKHFCKITADSGGPFLPGENITIQALSQTNKAIAKIAYSAEQETNSLFASILSTDSNDKSTVGIANIRHLENLYSSISNFGDTYSTNGKTLNIRSAKQTTDLSWPNFKTDIGGTVSVYPHDGTDALAGADCFVPVGPTANFASYDGDTHTIAGITVAGAANAGVFSTLTGCNVSNLRLLDSSVSGTNAGALAGTVNGGTITNVLAVHSVGTGKEANKITGTDSAGGLIGSMTGGTVTKCAAALLVDGGTTADAGGLIGTVSGTATVTGCYSGGHTTNGKYTTSYNVTGGGTVGGLIGDAGGATIENCYSTCSASGGTVGGLVGTAGGSIKNCYATGLVNGTAMGAFAGTYTGTADNCNYYKIINESPVDGDSAKGYTYLDALSTGTKHGITALDGSADIFNGFVGGTRKNATPFDGVLRLYYQSKYGLKTVGQLGADVNETATETNPIVDFVSAHYGDWPAPETWVVND